MPKLALVMVCLFVYYYYSLLLLLIIIIIIIIINIIIKKGPPEDFEFALLDEDWDHFSVLMEGAMHRCPALETAQVM